MTLRVLFAPLRELLHQAAGSKVLSNLGLAIAGLGTVCAQLGDAWVLAHLGPHAAHACGWMVFGGTLLAYFGRGGAAQNRRSTDARLAPGQPSDGGPA